MMERLWLCCFREIAAIILLFPKWFGIFNSIAVPDWENAGFPRGTMPTGILITSTALQSGLYHSHIAKIIAF